MNFEDLKELTVEELRKKIVSTRQQLFQLKMKASLGTVQNPLAIRHHRRDIAKMKTALNSKLT
jgi:large subunit ribosomal protein L29